MADKKVIPPGMKAPDIAEAKRQGMTPDQYWATTGESMVPQARKNAENKKSLDTAGMTALIKKTTGYKDGGKMRKKDDMGIDGPKKYNFNLPKTEAKPKASAPPVPAPRPKVETAPKPRPRPSGLGIPDVVTNTAKKRSYGEENLPVPSVTTNTGAKSDAGPYDLRPYDEVFPKKDTGNWISKAMGYKGGGMIDRAAVKGHTKGKIC